MIETLKYQDQEYPKFQASGNAARFIIPFAMEVCQGIGLDIGFGKLEWKFPGAIGIDTKHGGDALKLPKRLLSYPFYVIDEDREIDEKSRWDYIFSSHCLEHLDDWVRVLDYWYENIRIGGVLFLYLPAYSQEYWRPWNNTKHKHIFTPEIMFAYFSQKGFKKIFVSGIDLNDSFAIMGEK